MHVRVESLESARPSTGRAPWNGLGAAVSLLTIVPVPGAAVGLSAGAGWFALVGAGVGALGGGVRLGAEAFLPRAPATVLAIVAIVLMSGALHQDGLADTADALGARGSRERRLAVMRDSAIGVYGGLALIAWTLLLYTTLTALDATRGLLALTVACALGRWASLLHARLAPRARSDGLGAALMVSHLALLAASLSAVALALALLGPLAAGVALLAAGLAGVASALFARRAFGGRTGDTLGAAVALAELIVCVALLAVWRA